MKVGALVNNCNHALFGDYGRYVGIIVQVHLGVGPGYHILWADGSYKLHYGWELEVVETRSTI